MSEHVASWYKMPFRGKKMAKRPTKHHTKISMVPLEILVVMPRAWKKEVFSGPRPVFWAGTVTSQGAMAPARAAAGTYRMKMMHFIRIKESLNTQGHYKLKEQ